MENHIFNGKIVELEDGEEAVSYRLKCNDDFYDIGYKVMQNQEESCLLPCYRLKYNGKIKLVYFTNNYSKLSEKLNDLEEDKIGELLANVFEAIIQIEGIGFLDMGCIDGRLDHIYVANNTNTIKMIYLPVNLSSRTKSFSLFENEIRASLVRRIENEGDSASVLAQDIVSCLTDGTVSVRQIISVLRRTGNSDSSDNEQKAWYLKSLEDNREIKVSREQFILGKSKERAHGIISGNTAISRVHCEIILDGDQAYVTDLGSSNGTFVNGRRIQQGVHEEITEGSKLRLANMDFIILRR